MPMNLHINDECEKFMESFMESLRELQESNWESNRARKLAILEYEKKRKAELMEQCLQKTKKNIEFEKRKQPNSNKKETPMEYKAIKEIQAQTIVKKETPEEYKARKELQAQRKVKKETPEEYASRMEYMRGKEQLDLEAETQRLFNKAEKQYQTIKHIWKDKKKETNGLPYMKQIKHIKIAQKDVRNKKEKMKKQEIGILLEQLGRERKIKRNGRNTNKTI